MQKIISIFNLFIILVALWLLLSGYYTALLLGLGMSAIVLTLMVSLKMNIIFYQLPLLPQAIKMFPYGFWLCKEILASNIVVCRAILTPKLAVSPQRLTLKASQHSEFFRTIYANSITLTPGTITIDVNDDIFTVHALSTQSAADLLSGAMDRQVSNTEAIKDV